MPTPAALLAALLQETALFRDTTRPQLAGLAAGTCRRHLQRGQAILVQGQPNRHLHILLAGWANESRHAPNGKEVILRRLGPGDHVGECDLIDGQPSTASVVCQSRVELLTIDAAPLAHCMAENPALSRRITEGLVARLRAAHERIRALAWSDVSDRLGSVLADLAEETPRGDRLVRDIPMGEIAKIVGASRESVSRAMRDLCSRGAVVRDGRSGRLRLDPSALDGRGTAQASG